MSLMRACVYTICVFAPISLASAAERDEQVKRLQVGDKAIDFDLPVVGGKDFIELKKQYEQGPVVVIVLRGYPGYQCPICSRQVSGLVNRAKALASATDRVILVYPGEPTLLERHAEEFMGSRSLPEPLVIVRDEGLKMVNQWGLRWDAPHETAYPATYIIDRNGRVSWSKVSDNHAGRSTVEEIMKELRKLEH